MPPVQTKTGTLATGGGIVSYPLSFTGNVTAGDLLVFAGSYVGNPGTTTLTDPHNTWTKATGLFDSGANRGSEIWYCANCNGGNADTVTFAPSTTFLNVIGYLFEVASNGLDQAAIPVSGTTGSAKGTNLTGLASATDWILYSCISNNVAAASIAGWTVLRGDSNIPVAYQDASSTSVTAPTQVAASGVWVTVGTAFLPAGPATITGTAALALGPLTVASGSLVISTTVNGSAVLNIGPVTVTAADFVIVGQGHAAIRLGPVVLVSLGGRIGPGAWPVPGYRGRWRLTLHNRAFAPATLASTMIAELADARGRQLVQAWNTPAVLTFTLDGHSQSAGLVEELLHDVVAWRWDDQTGLEQAVFRGVIAQAQDQITTEAHTVTFTCHDYTAMLARRILTSTYTVTARDQDLVVGDLLALASSPATSSGTALTPASFLPVSLLSVDPAGVLRGLSGQLRDRTLYGNQNVGTAVDDLSKVGSGFDYDVRPSAVDDHDSLRVFYPRQGVTRTDIALQYGSTVAAVTRTVDSSVYANYVRVLGNNTSANPTPQLYAENWTAEAHSIATTPVGLWMADVPAAANTVATSLADQAAGALNLDANLEAAYTVGLTPDAYTWGNPNMGDTVPLIVASGRLNINDTVRVLGITYVIGDDGQEDVDLVLSRPQSSLAGRFAQADRDVKDLARR